MFLFALGVLIIAVASQAESKNLYSPLKNETAALELAQGFLDYYNGRIFYAYQYTLNKVLDAQRKNVYCECYKLLVLADDNTNCPSGEIPCNKKPKSSDKKVKFEVIIEGDVKHRRYNETRLN